MSKPPAQDAVTRVYDRAARWYDVQTAPMEWLGGARRRRRVLSRAQGEVLEVGIGTGLNLDCYASEVRLTGIDISSRMLDRARARAERMRREVSLRQADVQRLDFADASFDTVAGTCVFCSVADPVAGLREVARVVKPDGEVLLLEHVRPTNPMLGWLADRLSPLTRQLMGPEINRRTEDNIRAAGLELAELRRDGIWREIVARRTPTARAET